MDKEPITSAGLESLKEELIFLKEKKRPEIVAAISEARSHGDLKENAEYHAAKEEQSHNEGRIAQINDIIARANVIDVTKLNNDGKVIFGSTVDLENLDTGEKITYKIVGRDEADLQKKLIFFQSPIGKGLIGKNKNDLVEIKTPAGVKNFEIKTIWNAQKKALITDSVSPALIVTSSNSVSKKPPNKHIKTEGHIDQCMFLEKRK